MKKKKQHVKVQWDDQQTHTGGKNATFNQTITHH